MKKLTIGVLVFVIGAAIVFWKSESFSQIDEPIDIEPIDLAVEWSTFFPLDPRPVLEVKSVEHPGEIRGQISAAVIFPRDENDPSVGNSLEIFSFGFDEAGIDPFPALSFITLEVPTVSGFPFSITDPVAVEGLNDIESRIAFFHNDDFRIVGESIDIPMNGFDFPDITLRFDPTPPQVHRRIPFSAQ